MATNKKNIKVRDLKPKKDAKGGFQPVDGKRGGGGAALGGPVSASGGPVSAAGGPVHES